MSDQWYYAKSKQRSGPVSLDQLKTLAASGQLLESDLVWCKGMAAWAPANTVPDLFADAPPPLPDDGEPPPLEADDNPATSQLESLLESGDALLDSGDYEEADAFFTDALKTDPKSVKAHLGRGIARSMLDDEEVAIAAFSQAIALDPSCGDAYRERASAFQSLERYEEAIADADKAVTISPTDFAALLTRGQSKRLLNRHDEACADFTAVITTAPQLHNGWYERGKTLSLAGKDAEGIPDLKRALSLCDSKAVLLHIKYWLAVAYQDSGDPTNAIALFEELQSEDDIPDSIMKEVKERIGQCRSDFISGGDEDVVVAEEIQDSDETQETPTPAAAPASVTHAVPPPVPPQSSQPHAPHAADPIQDGIKAIGDFFAGMTKQGQIATPSEPFAATKEALKSLGGFFNRPNPTQPPPKQPKSPPTKAPQPAANVEDWEIPDSDKRPSFTITNSATYYLAFDGWTYDVKTDKLTTVFTLLKETSGFFLALFLDAKGVQVASEIFCSTASEKGRKYEGAISLPKGKQVARVVIRRSKSSFSNFFSFD